MTTGLALGSSIYIYYNEWVLLPNYNPACINDVAAILRGGRVPLLLRPMSAVRDSIQKTILGLWACAISTKKSG
jgi:hypothetical protein